MKNKRTIFFLIFFNIIFVFTSMYYAHASELRGMWVECQGGNQTLSSKANIDQMIKTAKETNLNAIFVQIYRANRCWFNSDIADKTPFLNTYKKDNIDLLDYIIAEAHKNNIEVHAWFNIFRIGRNKNADLLKKYGKDILNRDNNKKTTLDYKDFKYDPPLNKYYTLGANGYWLDAGNDIVRNHQLSIIREVLKKYPFLDGIHMDMIRNPYTVPYSPGSRVAQVPAFGYGKASVEKFTQKTGLNPFTMDLNTKNTMMWDEFRREQITSFVRDVYDISKKSNPALNVSASVLCWADRAYLSAFQDWRKWFEEGIIDSALLMSYSKDTQFVRYLSRQASSAKLKGKAYIGLAGYMLLDMPNELIKQIEDSRLTNCDGVVLFSYDSMLKDKTIFKLLKNRVFTEN